MGSLASLEDRNINKHIVLSNSGKADIYIHDTLKKVYNVSLDSIYEVKQRRDFLNMLELVNVQPYLADKWLFEIDYSKLKGSLKSQKGILESETSCFLFLVKNYRDFKEAKEFIGSPCNDLYLPIIRRNDVMFLLKDVELSEKVMSFVAASYSRDPELIFDLREKMLQGFEVNSTKDVVNLIGASSGSINSFVMLLLASKPTTSRGLKTVIKRRIQMGNDLCNAFGVSTFRNFLFSAVSDMLQIKILYMKGVIYNQIRDLPDIYDEGKLSRYSFYFDRIRDEIPYERLLDLYLRLQTEENRYWSSPSNMMSFVYNYYKDVEVV